LYHQRQVVAKEAERVFPGWSRAASIGEDPEALDALARLAVRAGLYPVYEIIDGNELRLNVEPEMSFAALVKYFESQGRFKGSREDIEAVRSEIEKSWRWLRARAALGTDDSG